MTATADPTMGLFGMFPTGRFLAEMGESLAARFSPDLIDHLYQKYRAGVESGIQRFSMEAGISQPILEYMVQHSGATRDQILQFLIQLETQVKQGKLNPDFLTVEPGAMAKAGEIAGKMLAPLEKLSSNMKWVGIAALVGVGLYMAWPYLRTMRKGGK